MEEQYFGAGRESANKTTNSSCNECDNENQKYQSGKKIPFNKAIVNFGLGLFMGSVAFIAAFLIMSIPSLNVNYILKSVIAMIFAFLAIKSYDKASGEVPTALNVSVASAVIMLFILSLIWGHNNDTSINEDSQPPMEQVCSESGTVRSDGDIWFASKIFAKGTKVKIEVEYNAIQMTGGKVFAPGVYPDEVIDNNGQVMFEGISKNPSKVTITYKGN